MSGMDALAYHRLHFAFTVTFHYLFPQLTMGLGLVIVILKYLGTYRNVSVADDAARFWSRVFGLNFVMGVVTGIPMEFQFGTNWSRFSARAGGVVGSALAMEGLFAFFLESTFLYLLLFGEGKLGKKAHFWSAVAVTTGSWLSGLFIVVTNAWMQHPVGYDVDGAGKLHVTSLVTFLTQRWALVAYSHAITGSVVTASFFVASIGAFYLLSKRHEQHARLFVKVGVIAGLVSSFAMAMPTGDQQARLVVAHQPVTFAAMEGHFHTEDGAGLTLIGQPNTDTMTLDNPLVVPRALSFMTHQRWDARIQGLSEFPREAWPDHVPLLYYAYHAMVGLGTMFIALMALSVALLRKGRLFRARPVLWALMLALPFPYIANTAGWMTAELGRQPWVVYGLMRTSEASSDRVSTGNVLFSLLGFMGLYAVLAMLFFFLLTRIVARGPSPASESADGHAAQTEAAS
jgi:cytochrome d ubiquinol oxidase subunit I